MARSIIYPEVPFLHSFVSYITSSNPGIQTPCLDGISWDTVKILFWPRTYTDEENAEPDVVVVSNKWVLVIEVKLMSGLGQTQPWREYLVGRKIAEDYAVSPDSVYYLIVSRKRIDISRKYKAAPSDKYNELLDRTSYLQWHNVVFLVDSWLRADINGQKIAPEHRRILYDLFLAMRKRRAIAFSGFSFANIETVDFITNGIFCPPRFIGFLQNMQNSSLQNDYIFLRQEYSGFGSQFPEVHQPDSFIFLETIFKGFIKASPLVDFTSDYVFCPIGFYGFAKHAPICTNFRQVFLGDNRCAH